VTVLRESGGDAAVYFRPRDPDTWVPAIMELLHERMNKAATGAVVAIRLHQASRFTVDDGSTIMNFAR
jgi:hypothetical protein